MSAWGIAANVVHSRAFRLGAKVIVINDNPGNSDRLVVRGLSKGGRKVTKWVATKHLRNFRRVYLENPPDECGAQWEIETHAANRALVLAIEAAR